MLSYCQIISGNVQTTASAQVPSSYIIWNVGISILETSGLFSANQRYWACQKADVLQSGSQHSDWKKDLCCIACIAAQKQSNTAAATVHAILSIREFATQKRLHCNRNGSRVSFHRPLSKLCWVVGCRLSAASSSAAVEVFSVLFCPPLKNIN